MCADRVSAWVSWSGIKPLTVRRLAALKHASEERGLQGVNHLASNQSNEYAGLILEFRIKPTGKGQEYFPICLWFQTVYLSFSREVEDKKTPAKTVIISLKSGLLYLSNPVLF